ncbi:tumor suppressor candidate 2 [Passer montanus]|uniref:tumor suppressor candidate 2 n=1 Tax=Passer montanus TaxID=9160 RepID=UPI001961E4FF|nr:tumor suppressor candidate 2 [Passer montanus]
MGGASVPGEVRTARVVPPVSAGRGCPHVARGGGGGTRTRGSRAAGGEEGAPRAAVTWRGRRKWRAAAPGPARPGAQGAGRAGRLSPRRLPSPLGSSMYYDEDGDLAHEFYEETIVTKNGRKRAKLKRIHKNLIPQGIVKLEHPRIHVDFPVIICEV